MTERKPHLDAVAVASLVGCCFLWGLNQVAAKAALPEIPALWQAALRSGGAAILVWAWARARGKRSRQFGAVKTSVYRSKRSRWRASAREYRNPTVGH